MTSGESDISGENLRILPKSSSSSNKSSNSYELFETFLSFLDSDGAELNSVLCGYWCNLFKVLVGSNPREVFQYIF
jgi:hypothetical protein